MRLPERVSSAFKYLFSAHGIASIASAAVLCVPFVLCWRAVSGVTDRRSVMAVLAGIAGLFLWARS
jgi:hypothetical protein